MFQSLELKPGGHVGFGGNPREIIGSGTVGNGNLPSISNVLLVDGLMHNLLSISQLSDNDYDIILNQKSCKAVEILATDTQCHVQCYDTVSDLLYDSKYKKQ